MRRDVKTDGFQMTVTSHLRDQPRDVYRLEICQPTER